MSLAAGPEDYFTSCGQKGLPLDECLVVDAHGHLGPLCDFPQTDGSVSGLIEVMDRIGIDRIYVSGGPGLFGQAAIGNDIVREAMRLHPDRIFGYMMVDVEQPETILAEMNRRFEEGFIGVKIWSRGTREGPSYTHPGYEVVFDFAQANALPVLAHTWGDELDQLDPSFRKYGNIKWLLAHSGSVQVEKYIHFAKTYENVYLETCLSACPRGLIEKFVRELPLHKIIWGTDQMFMSATHQLGRVLFARITPEQKQAILGANAAAVLPGRRK